MMVACVAMPLALFGYAAWGTYRATLTLADERIARSLDIVSEHALRVFQSIDVTIGSIEQITAEGVHRVPPQAELAERLKQMVLVLPDVEAVWLIDANGGLAASSSKYVVPEALDVPTETRTDASLRTPITIGDVVAGKTVDAAYFPVFARRNNRRGEYDGLTVLSVLPAAFERFYAQLAEDSGASFALMREDGAVLARYPKGQRGLRLAQSSGFREAIARNAPGNLYTTVSGVDQIERRFAILRLPGLPVYVSSSLQTREIIAPWLKQTALYFVIAVAVASLMFFLLFLVLRRTEALYHEAAGRELAEATLRQSQKLEAIGQLTGGVAHDFNNLLTIIIGNLDFALRQKPDERLRRLVGNAMSGAERAAQLTRRLLAFSRRQPLEPRPLNASRLIAGMSDLLRTSLGQDIVVETGYAGDLWLTEVDPAELESAILNLAINGRDAMKRKGRLTIRTFNAVLDERACVGFEGARPGEYVVIAVSDTGEGMTPETIEKAFDPFFTTKPTGAGTGLGLSQIYGFVKQSGGHTRIESEIGRGTAISLYLPRTLAAEPPPSSREPPAHLMGLGEAILVVEDDAAVRGYIVALLGELAYTVIEASRGEEALQLIGTEARIDLLLTDMVMPGINGRALAEAARRKRPGLRVLFMTGYAPDAISERWLRPGMSLIQKPLMRDDLAARLRELITS
jgi:two-component system NtrC family sensor kinase